MKKKISFRFFTFVLLIFCIFISLSCRKYNYTNRIVKTWVVNKYLKNGVDSTAVFNSSFKNYIITFDNNNGYTETYLNGGTVSVTNQGIWNFTSGAKSLILNNNGDVITYDVVSIKAKSMDMKIDNKGEEFFYSPQ